MKKVLSCILFLALALAILLQLSGFLIPKAMNRYYILDKYLEENDAPRDVQVFGSCHAYTSFNPAVLEESTGLTSFVYANPGEIIPTTYVRMVEQFKRHIPKVAVLDIWGINAYETYDSTERILEYYMPPNVQMLPYSQEKLELIADFDALDPLEMHFPLSQYNVRLLDGTLTELDFDYRIEDIEHYAEKYIAMQMEERTALSGYLPQSVNDVSNYPQMQKHIAEDDFLQIEPVIVKYLEKIIALCEENNVELIFYRAPYVSTENELRKLNHFRQICEAYHIPFVDLEQEMELSYTEDFHDLYHLGTNGAKKATVCLQPYILAAIEQE